MICILHIYCFICFLLWEIARIWWLRDGYCFNEFTALCCFCSYCWAFYTISVWFDNHKFHARFTRSVSQHHNSGRWMFYDWINAYIPFITYESKGQSKFLENFSLSNHQFYLYNYQLSYILWLNPLLLPIDNLVIMASRAVSFRL